MSGIEATLHRVPFALLPSPYLPFHSLTCCLLSSPPSAHPLVPPLPLCLPSFSQAGSAPSSMAGAPAPASLSELTPEEVARDYQEIQRSYQQGMGAAYEAFLRDSGAASGGRFRGGLPSKFKPKGTKRGGGGRMQ